MKTKTPSVSNLRSTSGGSKNVVKVKLDVINDKLLGNSLMGAWTMDSGDYGRLELNSQKVNCSWAS